ncbi:MAG: monovalent cation/H+ antiporter subunit D family protein [Alcanivorax sp.]|nr:monovalent cation/H+ antiporter subunit D family protein [Alcanivorax sp.]
MSWTSWMPILVLLSSLVTALIIFCLPENRHATRGLLNLAGAVIKILLVTVMIVGVEQGMTFEARYTVLPGVDFILRADGMAMFFAGLSSVLWLFTTLYAIGYLENSPNRSRFFGFFSLCVTSTMGIALAGNLFTFLLFYELLTLSTWPLVVHRGTEKALAAGRTYLIYTLTGGAVLLGGVLWLYGLVGDVEFREGGMLRDMPEALHGQFALIFAVLMVGLAVKAAMVPLHGWLPLAMVAPAPVSALLHAVAVVKAGAFGIIRVVYDLFGIEFAASLNLLWPLGMMAAITILYASLRALAQTQLKRRLAYSTISQVSYIVLGISLFGPVGTIGALVHLLHQGFMKITLFFCAGNYAETLGIHDIKDLDGAGKRMPLTSAAFTLGAFGMIGAPPLAGFISKWYLGVGAVNAGMTWALWVLIASSLLNALYFLPIVHRLWFRPRAVAGWPEEQRLSQRFETSGWLLWPTVATALFIIAAGVFAGMPFSPLSWAQLVAAGEYL